MLTASVHGRAALCNQLLHCLGCGVGHGHAVAAGGALERHVGVRERVIRVAMVCRLVVAGLMTAAAGQEMVLVLLVCAAAAGQELVLLVGVAAAVALVELLVRVRDVVPSLALAQLRILVHLSECVGGI